MSLGFSTEALLPSARVSGPLRMGLVRLEENEWLEPEPDLAARDAVFDAHPESVIIQPEAEAAIAELADLLASQRPLTASLSKGDGSAMSFDKLRTSGSAHGALEAMARSVWEDLCIITQREPGGPFHLSAAAVGFPTDWRIAEKIGRAMHEVHEPIHGYAEKLASPVDKFMDGLQSHNIFGRTNAFVIPSADLRYMPVLPPEQRFAHVTPENAGQVLHARCERETLRRLPKSRAILFTIGIYRAPLDSLSDAAVARLAESLEGYGDGELERRAAPHYAVLLADYAKTRNSAAGQGRSAA